jgi:selenocysteine-specific elongation factor
VLRPRTRVRFHLGTADVGARIVTAGGPLAGGSRKPARLLFDAPVVARAGDRFVLRSASPLLTIGGGVVTDPLPTHRRVRPRELPANPGERLEALALESARAGLDIGGLSIRLGVSPRRVKDVLSAAAADPRGAVRLGNRVYARPVVADSLARLTGLVADYHRRHPLEMGMPLAAVRAELADGPDLMDEVLRMAGAAGELALEGGLVRKSEWSTRLTAEQEKLRATIAAELREAGREPPSTAELVTRHGDGVPALLRLLEREGRVIQVEEERFYDAGVVRDIVESLRAGTKAGRAYAPTELREWIGNSRKYLMPLLGYLDRVGVTERHEAGRVVRMTA